MNKKVCLVKKNVNKNEIPILELELYMTRPNSHAASLASYEQMMHGKGTYIVNLETTQNLQTKMY